MSIPVGLEGLFMSPLCADPCVLPQQSPSCHTPARFELNRLGLNERQGWCGGRLPLSLWHMVSHSDNDSCRTSVGFKTRLSHKSNSLSRAAALRPCASPLAELSRFRCVLTHRWSRDGSDSTSTCRSIPGGEGRDHVHSQKKDRSGQDPQQKGAMDERRPLILQTR
jgi:hypothetical protein